MGFIYIFNSYSFFFVILIYNYMEIQDTDKLSYYERIVSHHHELGGIYFAFIDYKKKNIEYSEFIPFNKIEMIMPPEINSHSEDNIYEILDYNTLQIKLSICESRNFDIINELIKIESKYDHSYTFLINNVSQRTIDNITLLNKLRKEKTTIKDTKYGGAPKAHDAFLTHHFTTTIIYKLLDPVIITSYEILAMLDTMLSKQFYENCSCFVILNGASIPCYLVNETSPNSKRWNIILESNHTRMEALETILTPLETIDQRLEHFRRGTFEFSIFMRYISSNYSNHPIIRRCCKNFIDNTNIIPCLSFKLDMFDLSEYNAMKLNPQYFDYPFKSMDELGLASAKTLLLNPANTNPDNILKVQILQDTLDHIVQLQGRSKMYPKIHLLELLDPNNNLWQMRCEHFHLSKSPCVHNGLESKLKINHFLQYLNLWQTGEPCKIEAVTWIHTIGHQLDKLYCGQDIANADPSITRTQVFTTILSYFSIFINIMAPSKFPLCGVIPYINRSHPDYVQLFYYICINDMNAIKRKLSRQPGNMDGVSDNFLIELQNTSNLSLGFVAGAVRQPLIDLLIVRIKSDFSRTLAGFPFFNHQFAYQPIPNSINFNIIEKCRRLKTTYGCNATVSNRDRQRFNSTNIGANDLITHSSVLHNENYVPV